MQYNRLEGDSDGGDEDELAGIGGDQASKPDVPEAEAVAVGCEHLTLRWQMPGHNPVPKYQVLTPNERAIEKQEAEEEAPALAEGAGSEEAAGEVQEETAG